MSVRIPSRSGPIVDIGRNKQIDTAGGATRSDIEGNASDRSGTEGEPASGDGGHIGSAIHGDISLQSETGEGICGKAIERATVKIDRSEDIEGGNS